MTADKAERLMNLTICLLSTKRFVSKAEIRTTVQAYQDSTDSSFERMFERDKDELRALGVPIEHGSNDAYFDDEHGYRISPGDFELPPITFEADETTVLGLAARAWREASMAGATRNALAKLRAAGVEVDSQRLPAPEPVLSAKEESFPLWYDAVIDRTRVSFEYADRGTRLLEPWGMVFHRGRWYVIGRDVDKQEPRMFRLSRIVGVPKVKGKADAYQVPEGTNVRELASALDPAPSEERAVVAVRPGRAAWLRRRSTRLTDAGGHPVPPGFELYEVPYSSADQLVPELAVYGADVVVCDPPQLRASVIEHLRAWADASPGEETA